VADVLLVTDPLVLRHLTPPDHPERPARLEAVLEALRGSNLWDALRRREEAPPVDLDLLHAVHHPEYVAAVARLAREGGGFLDPDTFVSPHSHEAALVAAGGTVQALEAVVRGEAASAFALLRPPGHHALPDRGMGFCLFNNVALAAVAARDRWGRRRVLVLDWDVHHGNGTQDIFYSDPTVLYVSTHQENWYPGTGRWEEIGAGDGEGFTLNLPLPAETGDEGYRLVFEEVVIPLIDAYRPELILISAGYDAHFADRLSGMLVTAPGFRTMAELTMEAARRAQAGVAAVLEGGYDLPGLATSVVATLEAMAGLSSGVVFPDHRFNEVPYAVIRDRVRRARHIALQYWKI
jgi:acetoin utilization deacetylase AcuC-like enzyme